MDPSSRNSAADIPDEFKTHLARLYGTLHGRGVSRKTFLECENEAGYFYSSSTLDRWVARLDTIGSAIMENKESGNLPSLDREARDVTSGWVLHENDNGQPVTLRTFYDFVLEFLGVDLSNATISKYLEEDGFACRLAKRKGKSFVIDIEALRNEYWDWVWIQDFRARGIKPKNYASIDFTFTGHRTDRPHSFAPVGGPQPMLADTASNFTNCIVTCTWGDGLNRTPPMLFTYNSAFRQDRKMTPKRSTQVAYLRQCLQEYGISEDRVVYVGNDKTESRTYVRECPDLLRRFFHVYEVPPSATIYSDNGNSFFDEGESVLVSLGFQKHVTYPAKVHQYLSPNDNPLHGTSKQRWRSCGVDFSDDVRSCLALLDFLDRDIIDHSKKWWERNLLKITEEGVNELIGSGPCKLSHLHKAWKRSYEEFMNQRNS
jgi:hypothetical protein